MRSVWNTTSHGVGHCAGPPCVCMCLRSGSRSCVNEVVKKNKCQSWSWCTSFNTLCRDKTLSEGRRSNKRLDCHHHSSLQEQHPKAVLFGLLYMLQRGRVERALLDVACCCQHSRQRTLSKGPLCVLYEYSIVSLLSCVVIHAW
jgi:hypothetical protein